MLWNIHTSTYRFAGLWKKKSRIFVARLENIYILQNISTSRYDTDQRELMHRLILIFAVRTCTFLCCGTMVKGNGYTFRRDLSFSNAGKYTGGKKGVPPFHPLHPLVKHSEKSIKYELSHSQTKQCKAKTGQTAHFLFVAVRYGLVRSTISTIFTLFVGNIKWNSKFLEKIFIDCSLILLKVYLRRIRLSKMSVLLIKSNFFY